MGLLIVLMWIWVAFKVIKLIALPSRVGKVIEVSDRAVAIQLFVNFLTLVILAIATIALM